jgi:hypothetical protein
MSIARWVAFSSGPTDPPMAVLSEPLHPEMGRRRLIKNVIPAKAGTGELFRHAEQVEDLVNGSDKITKTLFRGTHLRPPKDLRIQVPAL